MNKFESFSESVPGSENIELIKKYEKIKTYAESQIENGFVRVYRGEGGRDKAAFGGQTQLVGTWFSPAFGIATEFRDHMFELGSADARIVSLIIPKLMLDRRDPIDAGMNQINVMNPDLLAGAVSVDSVDETVPTIDEYIYQYPFIRDLKQKGLID